ERRAHQREKNIEFRLFTAARDDAERPILLCNQGHKRRRGFEDNVASECFKLFEISEELNCVAQPLLGKNEYGFSGNIGISEPWCVRGISYGQVTESHLSTPFEQTPAFFVFAERELYERFVVMRFGIVRVEFKSPFEALECLCVAVGLVVNLAEARKR